MSYLYNGLCYAEQSAVYSAMAADCPPVTNSGLSLQCSPTLTGYDIQVNSGSVVSVAPSLELCIPEIADSVILGGSILAALAIVFAVRLVRRAI